jgi:DNA-binding protein
VLRIAGELLPLPDNILKYFAGGISIKDSPAIQRTNIGGVQMAEENTVFVGKKGTMCYVLAVVTQMNQQGKNEVLIKARGKAISRAVDVAEIVKNKFITDSKLGDIKISTEEIKTEEGTLLKVSAIEISLKK